MRESGHCPKCQGNAAHDWLEARRAELLPVPYYHVVFTLPAQIAEMAYQNKRVIYGLLFKASAETMLTIAADPKHLGAHIAITSVAPTWGSAMVHHPHVHMIGDALHRLPAMKRFHRIRHNGLFANNARKHNLARARDLFKALQPEHEKANDDESACETPTTPRCPHCQGRKITIETFQPGHGPRAPPGPGEGKP